MSKYEEIALEKGWKIIENKPDCIASFDTKDLKIFQFAGLNEEYVTWDLMIKRAKESSAVGSQGLAELMLKYQIDIPEEWRLYNLIFPHTIWRSTTGHMLCPFLSFKEGAWCLSYYWFLFDFHHNDRFLVIK